MTSSLDAWHDAFDFYPFTVKMAVDLGYDSVDMDTDGGEHVREIDGREYRTVRAFGHGEKVLVCHPDDLLGWRKERVRIIANVDGVAVERNRDYVPDEFLFRPKVDALPAVVDLPSGEWGLVYEPWRDNSAAWSRMKRRGLSFLVNGGDVARREGLAVWSNVDGLSVQLARMLPFYGWQGSEYLVMR